MAYALVHEIPPAVLVAESLDVLHHVLALEVVAQTPADALTDSQREALRTALLDERWGDAVTMWIQHTGVGVDVYDEDPRVWTEGMLAPDTIGMELQFSPLFRG
jgi:hypothetical protein